MELAGVVITGYVSAMRICTRPLKQDVGEDDHISNFSHTAAREAGTSEY